MNYLNVFRDEILEIQEQHLYESENFDKIKETNKAQYYLMILGKVSKDITLYGIMDKFADFVDE